MVTSGAFREHWRAAKALTGAGGMMDAAMLPVPEEQLPMAPHAVVDVPAPMPQPAARPQPAAGSFSEMAARLVDLRGVAKPPTFTGKENAPRRIRC